MPSSTQSHAKKRRRDDDNVDHDIRSPFPYESYPYEQHQHQHHSPSPRKTVPYSSTLAKKIRINHPPEEQQVHPQRPLSYHHTRSPCKQQSPPKPINISPCHICHRKPTRKSDLDSYADCESCGERTCYICIRQCLGRKGTPASAPYNNHDKHEDLMRDDDHNEHTEDEEDEENRAPSDMEQSLSMEDAPSGDEKRSGSVDRTKRGGTCGRGQGRGHWGRVCSQCCVEQGPQGEVVCLGCLEA